MLRRHSEGFDQIIPSDDTVLFAQLQAQYEQVLQLWQQRQGQNQTVFTALCETQDNVLSKQLSTLEAGYAADRGDTTTTPADVARANAQISQDRTDWTNNNGPMFDCSGWQGITPAVSAGPNSSNLTPPCSPGDLTVTPQRAQMWISLFQSIASLNNTVQAIPDIGPVLSSENWLQSLIQPSIQNMQNAQQLQESFQDASLYACISRTDIQTASATLTRLQTYYTTTQPSYANVVSAWQTLHNKTNTMIDTLNSFANSSAAAHGATLPVSTS